MNVPEYNAVLEALHHMRDILRSSKRRLDAGLINKASHRYIERKAMRAIKLLEEITNEEPTR